METLSSGTWTKEPGRPKLADLLLALPSLASRQSSQTQIVLISRRAASVDRSAGQRNVETRLWRLADKKTQRAGPPARLKTDNIQQHVELWPLIHQRAEIYGSNQSRCLAAGNWAWMTSAGAESEDAWMGAGGCGRAAWTSLFFFFICRRPLGRV